MKKLIYIEGMSCGHCVRHVQEALKEIPGVGDVQVNLQEKKAVVEINDQMTDKNLKQAIEEAGYIVTGIDDFNPDKGCEVCGR